MTLQRHALIFLKKGRKPLSCLKDDDREFFSSWTNKKRPLIYTRQIQIHSEALQVGIPYSDPETGKKNRYTYFISRKDVLKVRELPGLKEVFSKCNIESESSVFVYGSYCWQYLTKLNYVHPNSDLDILIQYARQPIDEIATFVSQLKKHLKVPRIDGEIRFEGLGDCAIRELLSRREKLILFKSANNVFLKDRSEVYAKYPSLIL